MDFVWCNSVVNIQLVLFLRKLILTAFTDFDCILFKNIYFLHVIIQIHSRPKFSFQTEIAFGVKFHRPTSLQFNLLSCIDNNFQ